MKWRVPVKIASGEAVEHRVHERPEQGAHAMLNVTVPAWDAAGCG
jgi:hypothetical protein